MMDTYSAKPSFLGYLYQTEFALLESVKRFFPYRKFIIQIEKFDDISFDTEDSPLELLQTKYHLNSEKELSDYSIDLWKSIRIWIDTYKSNDNEKYYYLITTAKLKPGSAAYSLGIEKNIDVAINILDSVAQTTTDKKLKLLILSYNGLSSEDKKNLFANVFIYSDSLPIINIDEELKKYLRLQTPYKYLDSYISRLKGFWYRRVIKSLVEDSFGEILSEELEAEMRQISDQLSEDNLPIDNDILTSTVDANLYSESIFVKQLNLIDANEKTILLAIRDFHRAFTQRSRWLREELLYIGDLEDYEQKLMDEWERYCINLENKIGPPISEEQKKSFGNNIYNWVSTEARFPIRTKCNEVFIIIGQYHSLADRLKLGWHPEFQNRLTSLLVT